MKKIYISIILLFLFSASAFSLDAILIGGVSRIKKAESTNGRYVLIENESISTKNGDILKTKSKAYVLFENESIRVLLHPFSRLKILDAKNFQFQLIEGTVWIENLGGKNHSILAGQNRFSVNKFGVAYIDYEPAKDNKRERVRTVNLKGSSRLFLDGKSYRLVDYQKLTKNKDGKIKLSFIPIDDVASYASSYNSYRGKISGWNNAQIQKGKFLFKPTANLSLLSISETKYAIISLQPRFKYKYFEWGIILPFYIDYNASGAQKPKNWGNYNEWNFESFSDALSDLVLKIDYFKYGKKYQTPLYLNAGNISKLSIKNSLISSNFKPNLKYPQRRQLSLDFGYSSSYWGIEAFSSDFSSGEIFGTRGYAKPLAKNDLFKKLELGLSSVTDLDPEDKGDSTGKKQVYFIGMDLNLPIYNLWEGATFNFLFEFSKAFIRDDNAFKANDTDNWRNAKGFAFSYGLTGTIIDLFKYKMGGLILRDEFPDSYFDALYLSNRKTKFEDLADHSRSKNVYGVYANLDFDFENLFQVNLSYRQVFNNEFVPGRPNNKFSLNLYVYPAVLDFAYMVFSYDRHGIRDFNEFFEEFFNSKYAAITASLKLPFKLRYLEYHLSFRRAFFVEGGVSKIENSYETGVKAKF